jgi:hypothetical protein
MLPSFNPRCLIAPRGDPPRRNQRAGTQHPFVSTYTLKKKGSIDTATGELLLTLSNVCVVKFALR